LGDRVSPGSAALALDEIKKVTQGRERSRRSLVVSQTYTRIRRLTSMQRFIPRRPSPAMLVAFMALFVALGATATALPGRNGVKKDDIVRGAVGTSEAANNSLRSRDVRNRTLLDRDHRRNGLTGTSINEARLGTVPGANFAGAANTANRATSAGSVDGVHRASASRTANGDTPILRANGFLFLLRHFEGSPDDDCQLVIRNESAGNNAALDSDPDFDQNEEAAIDGADSGVTSTFTGVITSNGAGLSGTGVVTDDPAGGGPSCAGSLFLGG
jgi:hypothetical protein